MKPPRASTLNLQTIRVFLLLPLLKKKKLGSPGFDPAISDMGGGNGQKAKMAREKNLEKQKLSKGNLSI